MPVKRSGGESSGAPKRTRFASPPPTDRAGPSRERERSVSSADPDVDNQFLEADITESSRGAKKREKRALRDQDGYGSDSSNDEESVVPSRRPGAEPEDDGDVDMFADEPEENEETEKGKKKKEKEFMDLEEIEGQEFSRQPEVEDDSDSEVDESKMKTGLDGPMGTDITPFNMKSEMEEGRFTADGEVYVENDKDDQEGYDVWLADADKEGIKKARRAHRERERLEREREQLEAERASGEGSEQREHALMRDAVDLLLRGETVLEGLQRLGADVEEKRRKMEKQGGKKKSWAERQKERKAVMAEGEEGNPFAKLSAIVSGLQAIGRLDVDSLSREAIQRMLPRDAEPARTSRPPADTRTFQYRFSLAYMRTLPEGQRPVERETFGPFTVDQLNQWKSTGFFGADCENIEIRDTDGQTWGKWDEVVGK